MSFFKSDNGKLLSGDIVCGPDINLHSNDKTQEAGGWKWFTSEELAREAYGIPLETL